MPLFRRLVERSIAFDSEGGGGGGSGRSGGGVSEEEIERQAEQAVEDGRAIQKITQLLEDNYQLREDRRELREQLPSDDEIVLSPEEADQLKELGALGDDGTLQVDEVQERLEEAEQAEEELQSYRRQEKRREVYEAKDLNEEAAEDILPDDVEYEVEESDGEEEKEAYVVTEDGRTPVGEYIEENYSEPIQNALYGSSDDSSESGGDSGGPSVPEQTPAGEDEPSSGDGDTVEEFINERNKARSGQEQNEE